MSFRRWLSLLVFWFAAAGVCGAQDHWVATWAVPQNFLQSASPAFLGGGRGGTGRGPQNANAGPQNLAPPAVASGASERGAGRGPRIGPVTNLSNQTVRMIARTSIGGRRFRIRLTNGFGFAPVTIGSAHIAIQAKDSEILPKSDREILFNGKRSVVLIPGAEMVSDPLDLDVAPLSHLAISLFLPTDTGAPTMLGASLHPITYLAKETGDLTAQASFSDGTNSPAYYWISGLDVLAPSAVGTVVAMGDSITDALGAQAADEGWPSLLAARLIADKSTANLSLVNVGVSGNRLMADGAGISGLARFERHVLDQPGVRWLILLEGINDIGGASAQGADISASDVTNAYLQIIEKAHTRGIKVMGCTLLPYKGAFYFRPEKAQLRNEVNRWIRTSGAFDAFTDLDAVMKDPDDTEQIRPDLQRGDHLHPNAAGYKAMAAAFQLSKFSSTSKK